MLLTETLVVFVVFSGGAYSSTFQSESYTFNCTDADPSTDVCSNSIPETALAAEFAKAKNPKRRNAFNLYYMIEECTKCRAWDLLGYGNYCGFGGSGIAIDDIDRCCQQHDQCYDSVINSNDCWRFNVYIVPYDWKAYHGAPHCGGENNRCRREICQCDRPLTECLNRVGCP